MGSEGAVGFELLRQILLTSEMKIVPVQLFHRGMLTSAAATDPP